MLGCLCKASPPALFFRAVRCHMVQAQLPKAVVRLQLEGIFLLCCCSDLLLSYLAATLWVQDGCMRLANSPVRLNQGAELSLPAKTKYYLPIN